VLRHDLRHGTLQLLEHGEVLDQVEEPARLACPPDEGLQGHDPFLTLIVDPLPLPEMLPGGGGTSYSALAAVREQDKGVVPEQLGDRVLVVADVSIVGVAD